MKRLQGGGGAESRIKISHEEEETCEAINVGRPRCRDVTVFQRIKDPLQPASGGATGPGQQLGPPSSIYRSRCLHGCMLTSDPADPLHSYTSPVIINVSL